MIWHQFHKPSGVEVTEDTKTDRYGRFVAQPLERGWGTTVGNALRRALLSSIPGATITAVKIEGVDHEFSVLPGVVEDVTDVILNLKQIPLRMHGIEAAFLTLEANGAGIVPSHLAKSIALLNVSPWK